MTETLGSRTRKLVSALYKKTIEDGLTWTPGMTSNMVQCRIGDQIFQIVEFSEEFDDVVEYIAFVKDTNGKVKDRIDESMLRPSGNRANALDYDVSEKLGQLYREARRRATGAEDVVNKLLNDLGES